MMVELEAQVGQFCFDLWREPRRGRTIVLFGNNGSGKTHCAKAVQRWVKCVGPERQFVLEPGKIGHLECLMWHWPKLLDTFKNGGWDVVEDMFSVPLLIIDELGGGHDLSGVGTDKLCQVLSRREHRWTLITTNFPESEWEAKFDRRVASRLFRNATHVDLSDVPDYGTQ